MALDEQGNFIPVAQTTTTVPAAPTAADVYSSQNIAQAVTQPTAKLDLSDPLGIYDYYMKSPEMTAAQAQYQKDLAALGKTKATAASRQLAIEQNPLEGMQYIVGAQSRAGQLDAAQISALSDALGVSQSALLAAKETAREKASIAMEQRNQLTSLITQYPGAKITYYDTIDSAAKKIEKYNKEQEKEAEKKSLKEQARALGLKTSGSRKELEKRISKAVKNSKEKESILEDIKIAQARKDLNKPYYKPDGEEKLKTSYTETEQRQMINEALAAGENWESIAQTFDAAGIDTSSDSVMDKYLKQKFGY